MHVCIHVHIYSVYTKVAYTMYMYMFLVAARMYSNQTVGFLLQKLEITQEKIRVPTLEVLKHIINSCGRASVYSVCIFITG